MGKDYRILLVVDTLQKGGMQRRLVELLKQLVKQKNATIQIVVFDREIHFKEIHNLQFTLHIFERRNKYDISAIFKIYKLANKYRPNLIHTWGAISALYSILPSKILNIPLINNQIADCPIGLRKNSISSLISQFNFRFSTKIISNSVAGILAYKAPSEKAVCIYNGFDFSRIESLLDKEKILNELKIYNGSIIGMVGNYSKYKDYETFIKAATIVLDQKEDVTFIAFGKDYGKKEALKSLISKKHARRILLLESKDNIEDYINIFDVAVLTSFTEGISNAIMEYMALSKPVIATDSGGTNELIQDNKTGYLIKVKDHNRLASLIIDILNDKKMMKLLGSNGFNHLKENFSIEQMVSSYLILYQEIIK